MELMSIGKFAKKVGITPHTLRIMHRDGELIPHHTSKGGTRYYSVEQLDLFSTVQKKEIVVGYCRVSTSSQKDDLANQVQHVKTYMYAKGYAFEIIQDIGSGINYKKKGLHELIEKICHRQVTKVVVLYKDRLVRFGFELIERFCAIHGVSIEVIDHTEKSKEEELTDDLIQIITVFANRLYGQRSKKTKRLIGSIRNEIDQAR